MKIITTSLLTLLMALLLGCQTVPQSEDILFANIPTELTKEDASKAVQMAAFKRKWTVKETDHGILEANLDHRGYKALLHFTVSKTEIRYTDLSTYLITKTEISADPSEYYEEKSKEWIRKPAPKSWIENLQKEVDLLFKQALINPKKSDTQADSIENRLTKLKSLYEKGLITEAEYAKHKEEILALLSK